MRIASGSVSPGCYQNDCSTYGWQKLTDGIEAGLASLAQTSSGSSPYMQLDLGAVLANITAIRVVARADCCLEQSQYLNVYASTSSNFTGAGGVLCASNVTFSALGEGVLLLCPLSTTMRYVTVQKVVVTSGSGRRLHQTTSSVLSLQEVQALMDGKQAVRHYPLPRSLAHCP